MTNSVCGTDKMIGDKSERMSQRLLQTTHPGKCGNRLLLREIWKEQRDVRLDRKMIALVWHKLVRDGIFKRNYRHIVTKIWSTQQQSEYNIESWKLLYRYVCQCHGSEITENDTGKEQRLSIRNYP